MQNAAVTQRTYSTVLLPFKCPKPGCALELILRSFSLLLALYALAPDYISYLLSTYQPACSLRSSGRNILAVSIARCKTKGSWIYLDLYVYIWYFTSLFFLILLLQFFTVCLIGLIIFYCFGLLFVKHCNHSF